jgi:hypothetical protein
MASLYDLTEEWQWRAAALDDCETPEEYDAALAQIMEIACDISDRAEGIARVMRNKQAEADALDVEIKRLQMKKKRAENTAERLKGYMLYCMETVGAEKLHTSIGDWRVQLNPPSVTVIDADKIPERFLIPQPPKVDARAIIDEHKQTGELFDFCEIVRRSGVRFR